ncbi:MAG: glycosyltransferase family 2 protein [Fibrobacterota bacterium]
MQPLIDVVITYYNEIEYIKDSLSSVREQSDFAGIGQIIIVDDGSRDGDLLQKYLQSIECEKIKYIRQENTGLAGARNTGIAKCSAPYIAFLDADDIWDTDKIALERETLSKNPQIDLLYSNVTAFYGTWPASSTEKFRSLSYEGTGNLIRYYCFDAPIYPSTTIIRRSLLQELEGFDVYFRKGQDTELFFRIFHHGYVFHIDRYLSYRRLSSGSLGGDLEGKTDYLEKAAEKIEEAVPELRQYRKKRRGMISFTIAKEQLTKMGNTAKARRYLTETLKATPGNIEALILYGVTWLPFFSVQRYNAVKRMYKRMRGKY